MEPSIEVGAASPLTEPQASTQETEAAESVKPARPTEGISTPKVAVDAAGKRPLRKSPLPLSAKDRVVFYLMAGLVHVLSLIPDFLLYPIGITIGFLGYCLDRRHIPIGMKNLEIAFPEKSEAERRRILRASYINLGRGAAEIIRLGGFFSKRLKNRIAYERFGYWGDIAARYPGRGARLLSAHFGNFELLAAGHALHGHQIN